MELRRHREFRLLAAGQFASNLGDGFYVVALPWYLLSHGGSAVFLGTVLAAYGVSRTVLIPAGGVLADRWGAWTTMLIADGVRLVAVGVLTGAAVAGPGPHALVVAVALVLGLGEGLFIPGSFSIVPDLVPDAELQRANAVFTALSQAALLLGPVLGGLLVAGVGAGPSFAVDAASFAISALTLTRVRRARQAPMSTPAHEEHPSVRVMLRRSLVLKIALLTTVAANLGSGAMSDVALPVLARNSLHVGADGYGRLLATFGVGALAGTLVGARRSSSPRPAVTACVLFLVEAAVFAAVPITGSALVAATALLVAGAGNGAGNLLMVTAFQKWAPPAIRGRLMSVTMLCSLGVFPLSTWLGGVVVHGLGPAWVFWLGGGILGAAVLSSLTQREWRAFGSADAGESVDATT